MIGRGPLVQQQPAVHSHDRAVDERGEVGGEKEVDVGHFFGGAEAPGGDAGQGGVELLGRDGACRLRVDAPGATQFAVMPSGASSRAQVRVMPMMPAFAAA